MSVIHDLGYARYAGERLSPKRLWRVILRQHVAYAWKTLWRYKLWAGIALITTVVCGALMYTMASNVVDGLSTVDKVVRLSDAMLIFAYTPYRYAALIVSMTVGAAVIARDQESGAFTFYFSRPVRPIDYVLGKLSGQIVLMAIIFLAGPLLLALFRVGMSADNAERVAQLILIPRVLIIGGLATLTFATLPLAVSALAGRRTLALAIWAAYYIAGISVIGGLGGLIWLPLAALDPARALDGLALGLFELDVRQEQVPPMWAALVSLGAQIVIAAGIVMWRVQRLAERAVGASS